LFFYIFVLKDSLKELEGKEEVLDSGNIDRDTDFLDSVYDNLFEVT